MSGVVTLRVTGFDFDRVRGLVDTSVVAALDVLRAPTPVCEASAVVCWPTC